MRLPSYIPSRQKKYLSFNFESKDSAATVSVGGVIKDYNNNDYFIFIAQYYKLHIFVFIYECAFVILLIDDPTVILKKQGNENILVSGLQLLMTISRCFLD